MFEHAFIAGLHRSGTSLLQRCLGEHPDISMMRDTGVPEDEGQHLQAVYPRASQFGGPGAFGFAPRAHLNERSTLVSDDNRRQLFEQWRPYWDLNKPILLEKTPQNLIQTRFLQAMFPNSRFIILTRHPVAVAYATQKWNHSSIYDLLAHWFHCHELFEADRACLKRALVVRYEDLVADPTGVLKRVYGFLSIEPVASSIAVRGDVNEKYFDRWRLARRRPLSRAYTGALMNHFEDRAAAFGYSLRALAPADAARPIGQPLAFGQLWCQLHRHSGGLRRLAIRSAKRLRKSTIRRLGFAIRRRSAVH